MSDSKDRHNSLKWDGVSVNLDRLAVSNERKKYSVLRRLFVKVRGNNAAIYLTFILIALLSPFENVSLDVFYVQTTGVIDLYCSQETYWPYADGENATFVERVEAFFAVRDNSLNGVCAIGTLAFEAYELTEKPSECNYTVLSLVECSDPPSQRARDLTVSAFEMAVSATGSAVSDTVKCVESPDIVLCHDYDRAQEACLDSARTRFHVSSILGTVGIVLFPLFFWRSSLTWTCFVFPIVWGVTLMTYYIDEHCLYYTLATLGPYVLSVSIFLMVFQLVIYLILLRSMPAMAIEKYVQAVDAGSGDSTAFDSAYNLKKKTDDVANTEDSADLH